MHTDALMMDEAGQNFGKKLNYISILFNSGCKHKSIFLPELKIKNNINVSLLTKAKYVLSSDVLSARIILLIYKTLLRHL